MNQPQAAFLGAGVLPISQSGHRRTSSPGQPDADSRIRRAILVPVPRAGQIEDRRRRPRSEWDVGQDRMKGMS